MKIVAIALILSISALIAKADPLIVHEWGTFTSLQDETGRAIAGINSDEEKLPDFVHDIQGGLIAGPSKGRSFFGKGIARCHPDVTMRLETPVVYFYPKENTPLHLDVRVKFHGGWLTQFYPTADADAPGLRTNSLGRIAPQTLGSLSWRNLEVGGTQVGPPSTDHVWTSPRAVASANVKSSSGEAEKFLFYRGVGKMDAPLRVVRDVAGDRLQLLGNEAVAFNNEIHVSRLWLVQLRGDGSCAFQALPALSINGGTDALASLPARFSEAQFSFGNLEALRGQMHDALMREGLFADEAAALLNTWEQSYFKSAGLRLFFLLPQSWTDRHLPLEISVPTTVTRAMIGRIEIVTPEQRAAMRSLAAASPILFPYGDDWQKQAADPEGKTLRVAYQDLGRFRDALLLDEQHMRPSAGMAKLLEANGIDYAR